MSSYHVSLVIKSSSFINIHSNLLILVTDWNDSEGVNIEKFMLTVLDQNLTIVIELADPVINHVT